MRNDGWILNALDNLAHNNMRALKAGDMAEIYRTLIRVARKELDYVPDKPGLIFYSDLIPIESRNDEELIGEVLGEISDHERREGRPLLSAIVVHKNLPQVPGKGFYTFNDTGENDLIFWGKALGKVHDFWKCHTIDADLNVVKE